MKESVLKSLVPVGAEREIIASLFQAPTDSHEATRAALAMNTHPFAGHSAEDAVLTEAFATVAWARMCEPGDRVARKLVSTLGAAGSLGHLIEGTSAAKLAALAAEACQSPAHSPSGSVSLAPSKAEIAAGLGRWRPRLNRAATVTDCESARAHHMRLLTEASPAWPGRLADLGDHAPLTLWVIGDVPLLSIAGLAVVGSRACTSYGEQVTGELVQGTVQHGRSIISGAAYGIDGVAHRAALAAGGRTVAVLAGGADRRYPAAHDALIGRIGETGAVISEMIPGSPPTRWRFLMRNRLIAALAEATLITEAGTRSGAINTAGHAAEIGRPLGAVPGPITSASSFGCFRVIEEYGAALITKTADLELLMGVGQGAGEGASYTEDPCGEGPFPRELSLHQRVTDALPRRGSRGVDEVARNAGITLDEAATALMELELLQKVVRVGTDSVAAPVEQARWALVRRSR
ncbi:DNA-processing protein DprA [Leucobacter sp. UCMA 4100]|uniref:DNA-processing protein DprA n=1 Tax=Leucobacter sp. UCMA 4100 TaxID=2810534 RepID=UPI0022EB53AF|nr:DNA-processing protein DprA [Leucobacter sp. UCMA 4100]MDA3146005.1 DNA-processing protein DprA [Leucobacter sp. UCMA 4100]